MLGLTLKNWKGDLFGGLTAGVVALPLALAFGDQSGLGAEAGMYGAIVIGIVAAIFGGTPTQISGPTAPMTVVSAGVIGEVLDASGFEVGFAVILVVFMLSGGIQVAMGLIKLGGYIRYIPYPVVSGFMSGIGVIIVIQQIFPFFGQGNPDGGAIGIVTNIHTIGDAINWGSVVIAGSTILIIYLFPLLTRVIPSTLIGLIAGTVLMLAFGFDIPIIGDIPSGIPMPRLEELQNFSLSGIDVSNMILIPAATLALLGAIDSLLTSVVADNITKTKHNSNQELIGQGIGNAFTGLFGGIPGAGATMRTVINVKTGGKTKLSGIVAGCLLLAVLVALGPYAKYIPKAVLAAILITVGIGIIDYKGMRHILKVPLSDAFVMVAVLGLTVFVDLIQAVFAGLILASLLFMKKMGDISASETKVARLEDFREDTPWPDELELSENVLRRAYIKHLYGPLFFGFTAKFTQLVSEVPDVKIVVLRMDRVPYIDQSGLYAIEDAVLELESKGIEVIFSGLNEQPRAMLEKIGIIPNLVPEDEIFDDFHKCASWLRRNLTDSRGEIK